jgi:hypothetical protein
MKKASMSNTNHISISLHTLLDSLSKQGNPEVFEKHIVALINAGYRVDAIAVGFVNVEFVDSNHFLSWFSDLRKETMSLHVFYFAPDDTCAWNGSEEAYVLGLDNDHQVYFSDVGQPIARTSDTLTLSTLTLRRMFERDFFEHMTPILNGKRASEFEVGEPMFSDGTANVGIYLGLHDVVVFP